ncbi:histidine kinase [Phreatobacter sp.]
MPTLFRFLVVLTLIAGVVFAGMAALAYLVEPEPRDMSVTIPPARLQPQR